jgi:hypothetical protein
MFISRTVHLARCFYFVRGRQILPLIKCQLEYFVLHKVLFCNICKELVFSETSPVLYDQVTKQHNEDCKRLLRLMGVPVVEVSSVCSGSYISGTH